MTKRRPPAPPAPPRKIYLRGVIRIRGSNTIAFEPREPDAFRVPGRCTLRTSLMFPVMPNEDRPKVNPADDGLEIDLPAWLYPYEAPDDDLTPEQQAECLEALRDARRKRAAQNG